MTGVSQKKEGGSDGGEAAATAACFLEKRKVILTEGRNLTPTP